MKKFKEFGSIIVSKDKRFMIAESNGVIVYDFKTQKKITKFTDIRNPYIIFISCDSKYLAVKTTTGKIGVYNLDSLSLINIYKEEKDAGFGSNIWMTSDNACIVDGDWNGNIRLLNFQKETISVLKTFEEGKVNHIEFNEKDNTYHAYLFSRKNEGKHFVSKWKYDKTKQELIEISESNHLSYKKYIGKKVIYNNLCNTYTALKRNFNNMYELTVMDESLDKVLLKKEMGQKVGEREDLAYTSDGKYLILLFNNRLQIYSKNLELLNEITVKYNPFNLVLSPDNQNISFYAVNNTKGSSTVTCYLYELDELLKSTDEEIVADEGIDLEVCIKSFLENGIDKGTVLSLSENNRLYILARYTLLKADKDISVDLFESIKKMPKPLQVIHTIWWFIEEVDEGGVSHYLKNTSGVDIHLLYSLKTIGSEKIYQFISDYFDVYELKDNEWEMIDIEFNMITEDIIGLVDKYILENLDKLSLQK